MNEEAFSDVYQMFSSGGYEGSPEEFYNLISTNDEARADALKGFRQGGYHGNDEDFQALLGINQLSPELEQRADDLFGGEIQAPGIGMGDGSFAGAAMDNFNVGQGLDFQNLKKEAASDEEKRKMFLADPQSGTWAGYMNSKGGHENLPPTAFQDYQEYLKEYKRLVPYEPTTKEDNDNQTVQGYPEEENIFQGLEFDNMAGLGDAYDPRYFQEWVTSAKDGTITQYAKDRLQKNGPTEGMTTWAKDKYGYTAKDEIIEAVEMDPSSPWSEYFFPMSNFTQKYKTGVDKQKWLQKPEGHWETESIYHQTEDGDEIVLMGDSNYILDKQGILNPNYNNLLFLDPNNPDPSMRVPEVRIKDEVWDSLPIFEKKRRIMMGEGDYWQQQEINDKYGDDVAVLQAKLNAVDKDLFGNDLELNFDGTSVNDLANLYTFFTGQSPSDAYKTDEFGWHSVGFDPSFEGSSTLERFINDPFVDASKKRTEYKRYDDNRTHYIPLEQSKMGISGGEVQGTGADMTKLQEDLLEWWEEYQKKPKVQAFITAQSAASNKAERDKLLEKHNGNNETALTSINDEVMRLPEMKWGYSSIDRANKRIKEIEAMDVSEGTKESMIKYWEKFIDDTRKDWEYGDKAFDEENMFLSEAEWESGIPQGAYVGPGSMWYNNEEVTSGGTPQQIAKAYNNDKERLGEAIINKRAELQRLINLAAKDTGQLGADRGNIQKAIGGISNYIDSDNETWHRDARTLSKMAKSGELDADFRDLRSNHPLAQQINQAKQQLVALNMAYSLNIDPSTTEKELYKDFASGFGSVVDELTFAVSGEKVFDNIEGYGKDELAENFVMALEQDGITVPQTIKDRVHTDMIEGTRDMIMPLLPMLAEIAIFKRLSGGTVNRLVGGVGDYIKYSTRVGANSPKFQSLVSTIIGGTVKKGTKFQRVMQSSAVKEMITLAGADFIGNTIYGRDYMDPLFGASLGGGMAMVENGMINLAGKSIPFFTPLMNTIARGMGKGPTNLLRGGLKTTQGAAIGTGLMTVSEGVVAFKNYLFDQDEHALLEEFDRMTSMDHIVSTYLTMHILGLKRNSLYDNLTKDFNTIVKGNTPEYRAARKTLEIDKFKEQEVDLQQVDSEGKPLRGSELQKTQENTLQQIEQAYNSKVEQLKSDPKYKGDLKPGGEVVQGSKLEIELKKAAEAKLELYRYNDIMLAKAIAKANSKATGSYQKWKNDLWSTSQAIKSNRELNSEQIQFLSHLDPKILADMTGMDPAMATRIIKEGTAIMQIADASTAPKTGRYRREAIEAARDLVEKTKSRERIKEVIKNNPLLEPEYKLILEKLNNDIKVNTELIMGRGEGSLYFKDLPRRQKLIEKDQAFVEGAVEQIKEVVGEGSINFKPVETTEQLRTILEKEGKNNIEELLESDAYFDPVTNTLYTNKEVMLETGATSAAVHELGHWFLRNSFKQKNPKTGKLEITPEGIELIEQWKGSLPLEQRRVIEKRIKDNYARTQGRFNKRNAYYEEYITSYIDAVRKGQAKITRKGLSHLMKRSDSAKALEKLGIDIDTPEGLQRFIESLTKSARKGKLSTELIEFAKKEKPKTEAKITETKDATKRKQTKSTKKKTAEVKEEADVKQKVKKEAPKEEVEQKEEAEEKEKEPVTVKQEKKYSGVKNLLKDLNITDKEALKEIETAEANDISGKPPELLELSTNPDGSQTVKIRVGGKDLVDIPIGKNITPTEVLKSITKPSRKKINTYEEFDALDWKKYKTKEEWMMSPEYSQAADFLFNSPLIKKEIKNKVTIDDPNARMETLDKLVEEFMNFDPSIYKDAGPASLMGYLRQRLKWRAGDVGKKAVKQQAESLDKPTGGKEEGKVMTKKDLLESKPESTETTEAKAPVKSTISETLEFTPKEKEQIYSIAEKYLTENLSEIKDIEKDPGKLYTSNLKKLSKELTPLIMKKVPMARNVKEYSKFLGEVYDWLEKKYKLKVEDGRVVEGDPFIFVNPGGKGYEGFAYKRRGVTEKGSPKRVQVRKGKENVLYDWMEFKDSKEGKEGQITKQDWIDFHLRQGKYRDWPSRPNELRGNISKKGENKPGPLTNLLLEVTLKDALPKALEKAKESLGETQTQRDLVTDYVLSQINKRGNLVLSKSKQQKVFTKEQMEDMIKDLPDIIRKEDVVNDLKALNALQPDVFKEVLRANQAGKLGEFLNKNPLARKYLTTAALKEGQRQVMEGKKSEKWFSEKLENSGLLDEIPGINKENILSPLVGSKKGRKYINEELLTNYRKEIKKLAPYLKPIINKMSTAELQHLLGESSKISGMRDFGKNVDRWDIQGKDGKFRKADIGEGGKDRWMMESLAEELKRDYDKIEDIKGVDKIWEGVDETLGNIIGESSLRGSRWGKIQDAARSQGLVKAKQLARELITSKDNAAKRDMYFKTAKALEKYVAEGKTPAEKAKRIETVGRMMKAQTSLVKAFRQWAPTYGVYIPRKGSSAKIAKLEHLKTSLAQQFKTFNKIARGEVGTPKELLEGYLGMLGESKRFDILDDGPFKAGRTNTSELSRLTSDLNAMKDYWLVEKDFNVNAYTDVIQKLGKSLRLDKATLDIMKQEYSNDAVIMSILDPMVGKEMLKQITANKENYSKLFKENEGMLPEPMKSKSKKSSSISDQVNKALIADRALENGRKLDRKVRKARVFDFDDTVAKTNSKVFATKGKEKITLTAEDFAKEGERLVSEGWEMDFSDFNRVVEGKKGPLFEVMKKMKEAAGERDMFILTARAPESAPAIHTFLKEMGIDIPLEHITGLGDSAANAKASWLLDKFAEGYNDFYFADDAIQNVEAVKTVLDQLDVKSKVQQAYHSMSKDLSGEFNRILEASTGVEWFKEFSPAKAEVLGKRKGKGKFFLPPGAEDFLGLVYPTLGKGRLGENQLKWYEENLFKPYNRGVRSLATERTNMMADFKALKKQLNVPKNLRKTTKSGFTNEQAVRTYLWNEAGVEVPGLSKTDLKELTDIVLKDPKLKAFADQIKMLLKGDGYSTPKKTWLSGTITTDLIDILNTTKRDKFLKQWKENVDIIFSNQNLNKLEAIYGKNYREALENSIRRMKTGINRTSTGNRFSDGLLDYINGAQGTIMFLNMRSALLQSISAANYINMGFNNPIKAGKALANMPQYSKDFVKIMNSDYLVDRRNGLKLNISESEIADAAGTSRNKAKAIINYILEKGYAPTKFMDSFAIASGGATWYRNRLNELVKKEGMSPKEAEAKAWEEFVEISEKSQQSSDPSKISKQQASDTGRIFLQFVNTPMQYTRLQKRAFQDLVNKRGDWKGNIGKILYYGVMQNLWFNAMQQGLFALGFGDEEIDEKEEKRLYNTANGMADSILRGLGMGGMTVSVLKNTIIDIYRRSKKKRPEYSDAWIKLLEFSPAIKSKMSKLRSAGWPFDSKKRRQEIIDKGFSLDNPAWESFAKVVSATTNLPLDRLYTKYNNISAMAHEDAETWQQIALFLGWPAWDIAPELEEK